ncbi:transcriptional repressor [Actinosynnema sp. NPDC023794]
MLRDAVGGTTPSRTRTHREVVLRVLEELPGPATAYVIHHRARDTGARIGLTTIYRHLASLVETGTAGAMRDDTGQHLYYLRSDDGRTHTLMCTSCSLGVPVEATVVAQWAVETAVAHGFSDIYLSAALTGVCPRCRTTGSSK